MFLVRDTLLYYLSPEDQVIYNSPHQWDEIRLRVARFIEGIEKNG